MLLKRVEEQFHKMILSEDSVQFNLFDRLGFKALLNRYLPYGVINYDIKECLKLLKTKIEFKVQFQSLSDIIDLLNKG